VRRALNDLETNVRSERHIETFEAVQFVFLKALALIYLRSSPSARRPRA
jgi:hypothetical protein